MDIMEKGSEWQELPETEFPRSFQREDDSPASEDSPWSVLDSVDESGEEEPSVLFHSSPQPKKHVQFADTHGQPLVFVRTFGTTPAAYSSGSPIAKLSSQGFASSRQKDKPLCIQLFANPLSNYNSLTEKFNNDKIALENVNSCQQFQLIHGLIRAYCFKNCTEKCVNVRISFDSWETFQDVPAEASSLNSSHSTSQTEYDDDSGYGCMTSPAVYDLYEFNVPVPSGLRVDSVIEFAICYSCTNGEQPGEYWDNNNGENYRLQYNPAMACDSSSSSSTTFSSCGNNAADFYDDKLWSSGASPELGSISILQAMNGFNGNGINFSQLSIY